MAQRLKPLPAMPETCLGSLEIPWRRNWQPTPVLLPGKSHGRTSLVGYSLGGPKELDRTERLHLRFHFSSYIQRCVQLIPISQFIPCPHHLPLVTIILFSVTLFCKPAHLYHFFTYKWYHMIFVFLRLTYFTQYDDL